MDMLKDEVLAQAKNNLAELNEVRAQERETNDAALISMAKAIGTSLAADESAQSERITLKTTPNTASERDQFIRKVELSAANGDGAIPVAASELADYLQDVRKTTIKRNVRLISD